MSAIFRRLPLLVAGIAVGISLSLGSGVLAKRDEKPSIPLEELRVFTEVFEKIKRDYVEPVDDKTLLQNAIRGMLSGLDPHSAYLVPEDYRQLKAGTSGEFGGLGIEVGMENGFIKVIAPIDDTPAHVAGVKAGDVIIRLDDTPVKGMNLNDAVKIMRGKPGSAIVLTILREGVDRPLKIKIVRDVIKVTSVKSRVLEKGYGYVRITQFQSRTSENLREAVAKLKGKDGGDLKGLVLDLRNNPGGVLSGAVAVSDAFLKQGLIVYTEGRMDDAQLRYNAKPTDILNGAPLIVLVNGGSASASEIVAGALRDHRRALIVGTKTFGKGSVQTILPMENGSALKLTTARYFTPAGDSIQATGIVPDIVLENVRLEKIESADRLEEANLARHLVGANETEAKRSEKESKPERARGASLARDDFQLYEALNLLKGLNILRITGS